MIVKNSKFSIWKPRVQSTARVNEKALTQGHGAPLIAEIFESQKY